MTNSGKPTQLVTNQIPDLRGHTLVTPLQGLQALGFTQYESQAYISLLQKSPLTGYELAKASGIPRANIYTVLDKLEGHGAVVRLDTEHGIRYSPVAPEELIRSLQARLYTHLEATHQALCQVHTPQPSNQVQNFHGYDPLLDHCRALIASARKELLVALSPEEAPLLSPLFAAARARGVSVTTLCLAGCPHTCDECQGDVHRYHLLPESTVRYLLLLRDEFETVAGEIDHQNRVQAIRTRQKLIVDLISWHIRNSIALGAIITDTGEKLDNLLGRHAWSALTSIGACYGKNNWLAHLRQLLEQHLIEAQ